MARKAKPVIEGTRSTEYTELDTVIAHGKDSVTFQPGAGDSGQRIDVVKRSAECCESELFVRHIRVHAFMSDDVAYYCTNPACEHYHRGDLDYGLGQTRR